MAEVRYLYLTGPPSSPLIGASRRQSMMAMVRKAQQQKIVTENPSEPALTVNVVPLTAWTMAAIDQAIPIPRKTFTALLPVTFPTDESAYSSLMAATLLANVSEKKKRYAVQYLSKKQLPFGQLA